MCNVKVRKETVQMAAFNVLDYSRLFVLTCHILADQTWFELLRVKLYRKWPEVKRKLLQVSGRFELSRVRVTGGKITVNV